MADKIIKDEDIKTNELNENIEEQINNDELSASEDIDKNLKKEVEKRNKLAQDGIQELEQDENVQVVETKNGVSVWKFLIVGVGLIGLGGLLMLKDKHKTDENADIQPMMAQGVNNDGE